MSIFVTGKTKCTEPVDDNVFVFRFIVLLIAGAKYHYLMSVVRQHPAKGGRTGNNAIYLRLICIGKNRYFHVNSI
jgi:hypothetical protein